MNLLQKIFGKTKAKKKSADLDSFCLQINSVDEFSKLSIDSRIMTIMKLGDREHINMSDFKFFQFAIISDPDINVKYAALKRIHVFKNHPDLMPMIMTIKEKNNYKNLEPYFSMTLSRLGLISPEDFGRVINKK